VLLCFAAPARAQQETPARASTTAVSCQVLTQKHLEQYASVSQALRGQVTGLALWQTSGQAGGGSAVGLRGTNSLQGFSPLLFVDGIKIAEAGGEGPAVGLLDTMNAADVVLIEIFKGPAATTLYGTDAAGGVIRIYTQHGAPEAEMFDDVKARCLP
jgi:outer membrane cobalamin receptor